MIQLNDYQFWFVVVNQFLYRNEVLETVARRTEEMAAKRNEAGTLPCLVIYKAPKTNNEITELLRTANYDIKCAGIITRCYTFSPSKM